MQAGFLDYFLPRAADADATDRIESSVSNCVLTAGGRGEVKLSLSGWKCQAVEKVCPAVLQSVALTPFLSHLAAAGTGAASSQSCK